MMDVATFSAVAFTLYAAHEVGDHWVQSSEQAQTKGKPGKVGHIANAKHVLSLTLTKVLALCVLIAVGVSLSVVGLIVGLTIDAASHYWADRRSTLKRLANVVGKGEFYNVASHGMNGAYALDQSFHIAFLWLSAIVITTI